MKLDEEDNIQAGLLYRSPVKQQENNDISLKVPCHVRSQPHRERALLPPVEYRLTQRLQAKPPATAGVFNKSRNERKKSATTYLAPSGDGTLRDVLNGHGEAVADADSRVDGAESAFPQDVTNSVAASKGLSVGQEWLRRR